MKIKKKNTTIPINGKIVDTENVEDKTRNAPSMRLVEEMAKIRYLTEETKIGTWIDGKSLYRKVIIINNTALNKGDNTIAHGISNMDKGIKITCFNYNGVILPYINLNADSSLRTATFITGIDSTNIFFRVMNDSWGAQNNWCVIIEYTKTID